MYKAWYTHNIHSQIIMLFNIKKLINGSTNEFIISNISRYYEQFYIGFKGPLI